MKRLSLTLVFMFLVTSLVISAPATVNAQSPTQLTDLARFYPDNLPIFISFRTDDTAIHDADELMRHIETLNHDFDLPEGGLPEGLDMIINEFMEGETFESAIRTWLGDTIAIGVTDLDDLDDRDDRTENILMAVDINGRDVTVNFLNDFFERFSRTYEVEISETATYTLYEIDDSNINENDIYLAVLDDVMFIAEDDDLLPLRGVARNTLADHSDFQATIASLPEEQYNFVVYVNTQSFGNEFRRELSNNRRVDRGQLDLALNLLDSVGGQAFAGTVLDGRSLVLDIAQRIDSSFFGELGLNLSTAALDPAFLNHVPAGTQFLIHSSDLKNSYDNVLSTLRMSASLSDERAVQEFNQAMSMLGFGVRGLTGLEMEQIVEWWTGDFVIYLKTNEHMPSTMPELDNVTTLPFDFAFILEATDPAQASALVEGLANSLEDLSDTNTRFTRQEIGGVNALVITITEDGTSFPVELAIAANNDIFVAGTLSAVSDALTPDGSLSNDSRYLSAVTYVLPNSSQVFYASSENTEMLVNLMFGFGDNRQAREARQFVTFLESATLSQTILDDGTFVTRAVWLMP